MEENKTLVGTTNTETTAPAAEEKTEEKPRVELTVEPNEFDDDAAVIFLTGSQLREKINAMFRSVFADFDSCTLNINTANTIDVVSRSLLPNAMYVDLHFRETDVQGFHMLKRRSETKTSSLLSRVNYTIGQTSSWAYVENEDGLEALEEFLPGFNPKNRKKVTVDQWNRRIFETNMTPNMNAYMYGINGGSFIDVNISGFPIENILKKIYGGKKDGEFFDYSCMLLRTTMNQDVILQVTQLQSSVVNKLSSMVGINMYNNGIGNMYEYQAPTAQTIQYMNPMMPQQH